MIGLDTNVALFACRADSTRYAVSSEAITRALEAGSLVVVPQVFQEFVSVITRPSPRAAGLAAEQARDVFDATFAEALRAPTIDQFAAQFRRLLGASKATGARVHDVALAASYLALGVGELLTFNGADFEGLGLVIHEP